MLKGQRGQVTTEYALATGLFLVIFAILYQVTQGALKKLFAGAAFVILSSYR